MTESEQTDISCNILSEEKPAEEKLPENFSLTQNWPGRGLTRAPVGKTDHKLPSIAKRYTEEQVKNYVWTACGVRTTLCQLLDCTQEQLRNYIVYHPWMKPLMVEAREMIVNKAEKVMLQALESQDEKIRLEAAKTILRQLGRNQGYSDGANAFSIQFDTDPDTKRQRVSAIFGISKEDPQE